MKTRICLILVLLSVISFPVLGQEQNSGVIKVTGTSKGKYMPDIIRLSLMVRSDAITQKEAILQTDIQFDKMIKKLLEIGVNVTDIKLRENNFGKKYECDEKSPNLYFAYKEVIIDIPNDKAKFIKLSDSIATFNIPEMIFSFSFLISDSYSQVIKKELIQKATDNAFEIANMIAKQKNIKVGDIISIDYYNSNYNYNTYDNGYDDFSYDSSVIGNNPKMTTEISFREIELNEKINIQVKIKY